MRISRYSLSVVSIILFLLMIGNVIHPDFAMGGAKTGVVRKAVPQAKPGALKKPAVPAGMVSKAQAIQQIQAHQKVVTGRLDAMKTKYDKEAYKTLFDAFKEKNTAEPAMGYASSWSGNGLYLTWRHNGYGFYSHHLEVLKESERAINNAAYVKASDLAYLDKGMAAWSVKERNLAALLTQYVNHMAQSAYHLGEAMKLTQNNCYYYYYDACEGFHARSKPVVEYHRGLAEQEDKRNKQVEAKLTVSAQEQVFSAIGAKERIAVQEPLPNECQGVFVRNKNVPASVNY